MAEPHRDGVGVRTFRIASGAHLLSFTRGSALNPSLHQVLLRVPPTADIVINVDGLWRGRCAARYCLPQRLAACSAIASSRGRLCADSGMRSLFELSGLDRLVLIEESLDDALSYVVGRAWLTALGEASP
jgi:hypothetical protein